MDAQTQYFDEVKALTENDLYGIRSVPGVRWAVRLYKGLTRARAEDGHFRQVILLGLDDATLVGAPRTMIAGSIDRLREPDAVVIDEAGYRFFYPKGPLILDRILEMNERRAKIVGICQAAPPFQTFPVMFTRYSQALHFVGQERNLLSFVLANVTSGEKVSAVCARIQKATGLKALSTMDFAGATIGYYIGHTGIPINFGITVFIALLVGMMVAGQTFYIFTIENLKQFATLKAMGVSNRRLTGMILSQAGLVAAIGYSFGIAMCAEFFVATRHVMDLRGFVLYWPIALGTAFIVVLIVTMASLLSIRKVIVLEPAVVFRG